MKYNYATMSTQGFSCGFCGVDIKPGDPFVDCPDCGIISCKNCAEDGTFDDHECEEDDYEE